MHQRQTIKSRIRELEHDVTEKEDEYMFWYRQFEDGKDYDQGSAKTRKRRQRYLKRGKETEEEHDKLFQTIKQSKASSSTLY